MSVRWDAVVDRNLAKSGDGPALVRQCGRCESNGRVRVHVQLFGALAAASTERSIQVDIPAPATVRDVVAGLGRRLGDAFVARVLDARGAKHRYCRLFVAGIPVEDLQTPLDESKDLSEVEIILLVAPEGG